MIIELSGVGFVNKGAELMLRSVVDQVATWPGENRVALPLHIGGIHQRSRINVSHLLYGDFRRLPFTLKAPDKIVKVLPPTWRRSMNIAVRSEVNAALDASGFAYGDSWGPVYVEQLIKKCRDWKQNNIPVVLLPQAFGPFKNNKVRSLFKEAVRDIDLIFARDSDSYQYLQELLNSPKVRRAPDFTNLVEGRPPAYFDRHSMQICIIPNCRMFDRNEDVERTQYLLFLRNCIQILRETGHTPFLLVHEGKKDYRLAQEAIASLDEKVQILQEPDSVHTKGIIGASKMVISSRYHGIVSALAQGVPCLATGWSHKYPLLLADYDCSECLISDITSVSALRETIHMTLREPTRSQLCKRLRTASVENKQLAQEMWHEIYEYIQP